MRVMGKYTSHREGCLAFKYYSADHEIIEENNLSRLLLDGIVDAQDGQHEHTLRMMRRMVMMPTLKPERIVVISISVWLQFLY